MRSKLVAMFAVMCLLFTLPVAAQPNQQTITLSATVASSVTISCTPASVNFGNVAPGVSYNSSPLNCTTTWFVGSGQAVYQYLGGGNPALTGTAGVVNFSSLAAQYNGGSFQTCNQNYTGPGASSDGIPQGSYCGPSLNGNLASSSPSGTKTDSVVLQLNMPTSGITTGALSGAIFFDVEYQ